MDLKTVKVSAPGKVILHGEHSVMYGKTALAVSLGLRSEIVIKELSPTDEPKINIHFPSVGLNESLPLKPVIKHLLQPSIGDTQSWREPNKVDHEKHLKKVEELLYNIRPGFEDLKNNQKNSLKGLLYAFGGIVGDTDLDISDLDVSITSQLTVGAGTGSSASFAVCLCGAWIQLIKAKAGADVGHISTEEKKMISAWAFNCEKIMHGAPSGIDNTTCTYGSLVSFKKGEDPQLLPSPELRVLLVDSRVSRETSRLTAAVASLRGRNAEAVDHILSAMDCVALTAAELLKKLSSSTIKKEVDEIYQHLHELWEMNHCLLASLGVSHPALEVIRSAAKGHGLACKLTGAGGGGNAIVLIPPSAQESTIEALKSELVKHGFRITDTKVGGPGVRSDD